MVHANNDARAQQETANWISFISKFPMEICTIIYGLWHREVW